MLSLLLWVRLAFAVPEDALDAATRGLYEAASAFEEQGEWRRAAAGYRLVLSREPTFAPAVLGLGHVLTSAGDTRAAAEVYGRLPNDADAVEALARLLEPEQPERAAPLYHRLQTLLLGEPWPYLGEARSLLASDPEAALSPFEVYLGLADGEPDGDVLVRLAVALKEAGHEPAAIALLDRYRREWPEGSAVQEASGRLDRWAVERAARTMAVGGDEPLPADAAAAVEAARRLAASGRAETALGALRDVVRDHHNSAEAWGALGDVHRMLGRPDEAERAFGWAVALAPDESAWHARLGLLLAEAYGGRRNREASESLTRALGLRPGWAEIRYQLGCVHQAMGEWDAAIDDLRAYLDADPKGAFASDAASRLAALTRKAPPPPALREETGCTEQVEAAVCDHYRVARIYQDRGDLLRARQELDLVLALAPEWPAALNLSAALDLSAGETPRAVEAWQRSLEVDPAQPRVLLGLGELARREGRQAEAEDLFRRAADAGAGDAHYYLAEIAFQADEVQEAAAELDAYFSAATGGLATEPARALRARVDARIRQRQVAISVFGLLGLVGGLGLLIWRRSGRTLTDLVRRAPEAVQDTARILSALRHEVLKHNTTLLGEAARAVDEGDHRAVAFAASRLYGRAGDPGSGVLAKFEDYLGALERLGRRHGVRLDLRRRDPVIAPMQQGMRRLRRLERELSVVGRPARPGLSSELRALSTLLNETCYQALGRLIREMSTLKVSRELLLSLDEAVRAEPAFSGQALPDLALAFPGEALPARILRGDLEDVVKNLLRNAYRAVGEALPPAQRRVGIAVDEEVDLVTGLESVVLRFVDNAPGSLTDEMIRTRKLGRGLGLVLDLVTRYDGSVSVETEAGWAKAVVVRIPRAEEPGSNDAEDTQPIGGPPALPFAVSSRSPEIR